MLTDAFVDLKVAIIPPPKIDHVDLVRRAASRRKPCDNNGDGYRDTLNWLTLLAVASAHPKDEIFWVSDNSRDFGAEDGDELHMDLKEELRSIGLRTESDGLVLSPISFFSLLPKTSRPLPLAWRQFSRGCKPKHLVSS